MTDLVGLKPVTGADLRQAMSACASGVAVITTSDGGSVRAMTATSLTSVSLSPPLVLICIQDHSSFHRALLAAEVWGVNVLAVGSALLARRLSRPGRPSNQLGGIPYKLGDRLGAPLLRESISTLECQTDAVHQAGDHSIFVGRVHGATSADPLPRPLIHHGGVYRTLDRAPNLG